jgi:hypothetical protein
MQRAAQLLARRGLRERFQEVVEAAVAVAHQPLALAALVDRGLSLQLLLAALLVLAAVLARVLAQRAM